MEALILSYNPSVIESIMCSILAITMSIYRKTFFSDLLSHSINCLLHIQCNVVVMCADIYYERLPQTKSFIPHPLLLPYDMTEFVLKGIFLQEQRLLMRVPFFICESGRLLPEENCILQTSLVMIRLSYFFVIFIVVITVT